MAFSFIYRLSMSPEKQLAFGTEPKDNRFWQIKVSVVRSVFLVCSLSNS